MKNHYECIVTGESKYIAPGIAEKKISKFGTEAEFRKHYISPSAAKLLRAGQTVDEIRNSLGITDMPTVDAHVLARLNLLRKKKGKRSRETEEKLNREKYLNSKEFRDKMRAIKEQRENMSFKEWVEQNTGGPNRVWLTVGACTGTCIRPDIFLSHNHKACDGCPYHEHCLCRNKRLSHEKRRRR